MTDNKCIINIINIINAYINLSFWFLHTKRSISIIIYKLNKPAYNSPKTFYSIILLNILGKLKEKVISERLQIYSITSNFVYLNQLGDLKQHFILDIGLYLTYLIHTGQVKGFYMSTLAFEIAQFFPSLNHQLLSLILDKARFDLRISLFSSNYLIDKKIQYIWNNFFSFSFRTDVGVGQDSYIFEKRTQNLLSSIFVSTLSFVNDNLFISQKKSYERSNANLFCSYSIFSCLFKQFGLRIEHNKSEVFYFSKAIKNFNFPPLDLELLGESIL